VLTLAVFRASGSGDQVAHDVFQRFWSDSSIADYYLRLNVTKAWLSVRDNPALTVDELARERYKRDRITVVQPVAVDNGQSIGQKDR